MKGQKSTTSKLKNQISTLTDQNAGLEATIAELQKQLEGALGQAVDIGHVARIAIQDAALQVEGAREERDAALIENTSLKGQLGVLPVSQQQRQEELKNIKFMLGELSALSKHISGGDTDVALGLVIHPHWNRDSNNLSSKYAPDVNEFVILVDAIRSQYIETKYGDIDADMLRLVGFSIMLERETDSKKFDTLQSKDLSTRAINIDWLGMSDSFVGSGGRLMRDQKPTSAFMPHNKEVITGILQKLREPDALYSSEEIFTMAQMVQHHTIARQLVGTTHNQVNSDGHKERFEIKCGEPDKSNI